jgi:ketosteroid isomerase-like protein
MTHGHDLVSAIKNKTETGALAMSTVDVANAFTALLKAGDHHAAAMQFNSPDIVSIEAMEGPMARLEGAEAIAAKGQWWYENHEVHAVTTEGPFVNGEQFAVVFDMDITAKATGARTQSREVGLYTVRDGKIVEERFYY